MIVSANQTWADNHSTAGFIVNCPVTSNVGSGIAVLTAAAGGSGNMVINSVVSNGTGGGALGVTNASTGTGQLILQGANTYSGGTSVSSGTLLLDSGGSLAHSNIAISDGKLAAGTTVGATATGGAITDNIINDAGELISLSGTGVLDLTNINFSLNATGTQTLSEYVLANAAIGSSNVAGSQFLSAALPSGWSISYTGTLTNPNAIVLLDGNVSVPEPASIGAAGLVMLSLIRRRRR